MKRNSSFKVEEKLNAAISAIELNNMENYIADVLEQSSFEHLIKPKETPKAKDILKNAEFISVNEEVILTEEEFFNIVDVKNRRISSNAGRYQRSLYSHYMQSKREKDEGYRRDVLLKARTLRNNLKEVEELMRNEAFMNEWRNSVGKISPLRDLKENGRMRKINIVRSYIE